MSIHSRQPSFSEVRQSATAGIDDRLAAAAPDLLSACRGLLECAETGVTSLGTLRMARAAIAKAESDSARGLGGESQYPRRKPC